MVVGTHSVEMLMAAASIWINYWVPVSVAGAYSAGMLMVRGAHTAGMLMVRGAHMAGMLMVRGAHMAGMLRAAAGISRLLSLTLAQGEACLQSQIPSPSRHDGS